MKEDENIESMFSRFKVLVAGLKVLKKSYTTSDHVKKILRSLPAKWRPKVTAIQEAKDLDTLSLEGLISSLVSHEIELASDEPQKKMKSLALPATSGSSKALKAKVVESEAEESSADDQEEGSDDDVFALLSKKFQKWTMRKSRNSGRSSGSKGSGYRGSGNKDKKDDSKNCFNCHKPGHFIADCPELSTKGKGSKSTFKNRVKKSLLATWEDVNNLSDDEAEDAEANLALMATAESESDVESDAELETDDIEQVISKLSNTQISKALKDTMMKYMDKSKELELFKQKFNMLNDKVNHIQEDYNKSLKTIQVLENGCRTCNKPYDKQEIALQEFVHHNIDKHRLASMIYGAGKYTGQGLGSTSKGNSNQSVCISKPSPDLYSHFVSSSSTENSKVSDALVRAEPLKNSALIASVSMPKIAVQKVFKPMRTRGLRSRYTNLKAGLLTHSESRSKGKVKPKNVFQGLPHYGFSGSYQKQKKSKRTNSEGPIRIWVPKSEIMYTAGMHPKKKTKLMVSGQWMFTTHDRRQALVPHPESERGRNCRIWWEPKRQNYWYR
jgi:hypothetical protein